MEHLTTAHLKKNYKNTFDLVNYAIALSKDMITSDRMCRVPTGIDNRSYQVLLEIGEHVDYLSPSAAELLAD